MPVSSGKHALLELCVASVEDAAEAEAGGADRLELNSALALDGLTPSLGTFLEVKRAVRLPLLVMVRPRPGDFVYSEADFRVMRRDLDLLLAHGADGVVFGVLRPDGTVDAERCRQLARQAEGRPAVFHRAFDATPDPFAALECLIDLGFRRVLTSGRGETALDGATLLRELIVTAAGRIEVLPGGGITPLTVADVVTRSGCDQVHASLRETPHGGVRAARVAEMRYSLCRIPD